VPGLLAIELRVQVRLGRKLEVRDVVLAGCLRGSPLLRALFDRDEFRLRTDFLFLFFLFRALLCFFLCLLFIIL